MNHFAKCCPRRRVVQSVNDTTDDCSDEEQVWLGAVHQSGNHTVRAKMIVNDCEVNFELDSGAEVNTLNQKYVLRWSAPVKSKYY